MIWIGLIIVIILVCYLFMPIDIFERTQAYEKNLENFLGRNEADLVRLGNSGCGGDSCGSCCCYL